MKGIVKATNQCPRCQRELPDDEYDHDEDLCIFCLFPEVSACQAVKRDDLHRY